MGVFTFPPILGGFGGRAGTGFDLLPAQAYSYAPCCGTDTKVDVQHYLQIRPLPPF
jgi:hypothetical protein